VSVMGRFSVTRLPLVRVELRAWERRALAIPDPLLREHALDTLRGESFSAIGAALVTMTTDHRDPQLVRLLVALQVAWDYIDTLAEQPAVDPVANGVQLHRALVDALGSDPPRDDYYRLNRGHDDGGYLLALVDACRAACAHLPAYAAVAAAALRELETAEVQYLNHGPAEDRARRLRAWADRHPTADASWIELGAAASSSLGVLAMLTLAADPATTPARVEALRAAYVPWVDALTALLDSLVDRPHDAASGLLNWVSHYPSDEVAAVRVAEIAARAVDAVRALPNGERHVVIVVGMIAMHLSQATAWLPDVQPATRAVLRATRSPAAPAMLGLLRTWRRARAKRARCQAWRRASTAEPAPA
jgi:tetraprenyl-beta-curcumene synthase